jgi:hypothetical protein
MRFCHWVEPQLVCQVKFTELTRDERLRQPVFVGLREDKRGQGSRARKDLSGLNADLEQVLPFNEVVLEAQVLGCLKPEMIDRSMRLLDS